MQPPLWERHKASPGLLSPKKKCHKILGVIAVAPVQGDVSMAGGRRVELKTNKKLCIYRVGAENCSQKSLAH